MVGCKVDGPQWVVLGHSWRLCERSWAARGVYVAGLGGSRGHLGRLEPKNVLEHDYLEHVFISPMSCGLGTVLDPLLANLGHSLDLCWRSWAAFVALGIYVGGPVPLLGCMSAVSADVGTFVGGPRGRPSGRSLNCPSLLT